jgi:phosphatidylinositol alpha-1,6-mannosyltransferase
LVITNGADEQRFSPNVSSGLELRAKLGLTDARILLTVGHVSNRKGQDIVIRALPHILQVVPNAHYLIAGIPTLQAKLEVLASELNVAEHVHFLGKVDTEMLPAIYNACDVFILVSRHSLDGSFEGYGIVAVEAALCSKPAVVADNSGLAEAIQHGKTGFVVPAENSQSVAQAVMKILQDASLCKQMGEKALQRAMAEQTWSASMAQYNQALMQLVKYKKNNS